MKTSIRFLSLLLVITLVAAGCSVIRFGTGKTIIPSKVMISENRDVSGFSGIDMSTIGKVVLSQGSTESLTVSGSDNLVPLIKTAVRNEVLYIETTEDYNLTSFTKDNIPTYTVVVKDLSSLNLSGLGDVQMETLTTPQFTLTMSGGGKAQINQLTTDKLTVTVSGGGLVELTGEAKQATIEISGAGDMDSPDLKIQTANVTIPGLGGATLWVTDQLTGSISGAGGVSYYGNPQTDLNTTGLGDFKSLGNK